jgi:bacillithiol system protein YtxJ
MMLSKLIRIFNKNNSNLNWLELNSEEALGKALKDSENFTIIIFKHSTRCSISSMAKSRLESGDSKDIKCFYLDLIQYRDISDAISQHFSIVHQSPQVLLIKNQGCIYNSSHSDVKWSNIHASNH